MVALAPSPVSQPFGDPVPGGRAAEIVRGVQRMFAELGLASLTEVTLANGRRADLMAVGSKGEIVIVEVKSCLQDFQTDQKWPEYAPYCDRFYFAVDCDFPKERIPEHAGLMVCDGCYVRLPLTSSPGYGMCPKCRVQVQRAISGFYGSQSGA